MTTQLSIFVAKIDEFVNLLNEAKNNHNKANAIRVRVVKMAKSLLTDRKEIKDSFLGVVLMNAVATCASNVDGCYRAFDDVTTTKARTWFSSAGKNNMDLTVVDDLLNIRAAATDNVMVTWEKTSRGAFFLWGCICIKEMFNVDSVADICFTVGDMEANLIEANEGYFDEQQVDYETAACADFVANYGGEECVDYETEECADFVANYGGEECDDFVANYETEECADFVANYGDEECAGFGESSDNAEYYVNQQECGFVIHGADNVSHIAYTDASGTTHFNTPFGYVQHDLDVGDYEYFMRHSAEYDCQYLM